MSKYINTNDLELEVSHYLQCEKESEAITLEELKEITNRLPSADVVEVKHGKWKHNKNNDVIKCSECGFGIMDSTFVWKIRNCCGTIEDNPFNFCPDCGADMREREESE